jgi:tetratricopeptide (TPR) repeat protein
VARAEDAFSAATRAHQAGKHDQAEALFSAYLTEHPEDVSAWVNLGNTYAAEGRLGRAALSYERALFRDPSAEDAQHNLDAVRNASREQSEGAALVGTSPRETRPSPFGVGVGALACYAAAVVLAGLGWRNRKLQRPAGALFGAALLGAGGAGGLAYLSWERASASTSPVAVVVAPDAVARRGPFLSAEALYTLAEGERVEVQREQDGFVLVVAPGLSEGWLPSDRVERLSPP